MICLTPLQTHSILFGLLLLAALTVRFLIRRSSGGNR